MARALNDLRFARALLATSVKASIVLGGPFAMEVVFMILNNVTFFVFWWVLLSRVPDVGGWRLGEMQVLFGVVAAGFGLAVTGCGGVRQLGRQIDDGELDVLLVQPKPVLLHALGMRSQASGFGDMISGAFFIAWSGRVSWSAAPVIAVAIVSSALVVVASAVVFYSLAFWLGKMDTVARQLWELLITFSVYPEPLFGGALRAALFTLIPAGFVGYLPARVILHASAPQLLLLTGGAAAYLAIAIAVFQRGLRRYASGSRFVTFG